MAWEQRGGNSYYYRARKIAGRVVKEYCGAGAQATLAVLEDEQRRRARAESAFRLHRAREVAEDAVCAHEALNRAADALMAATLTAAGYHRHDRGQWRKRRARNDSDKGRRHDG